MTRTVRQITPSGGLLGESPVWDEREQVLYWVDIERGSLHRCAADGSNAMSWDVGQRLGSIALRRSAPGFIAGLENSVGFLKINPFSMTEVAAPEATLVGNRSNDGKCDRAGRFWFGTCDRTGQNPTGWLYRVEADGRTERVAGPFICTNGPEFSPDGRTLYCVDSYTRTIFAYDLDESGQLSRQRIFLRLEDPAWGYPDGLTCDVEGCLWVAHFQGGRISRFSPEGKLLDAIQLPTSQPTSCTFGGPDFKKLFITSESIGLDMKDEPIAGAVFAVTVEIGGFPAHRFAS